MLGLACTEVQQISKYGKEGKLLYCSAPYQRAVATSATLFMNQQALLECKRAKNESFNDYVVRTLEAAGRGDSVPKLDNEVLHQRARGAHHEKVRGKCEKVKNLHRVIGFGLNFENMQLQK